MSRVCREAMGHRGELTWPGGLLSLDHLLIKSMTGSGCTTLRQSVVRRTFTDEATLKLMIEELRRGFEEYIEWLCMRLDELVLTNLGAMKATLDLVREDNTAEESESDPEFRQRVADELAKARCLMEI